MIRNQQVVGSSPTAGSKNARKTKRACWADRRDWSLRAAAAGGYHTGDEQVDELIDLLEHDTAPGGWLGVGQQTHSEYVAEINRVIDLLDA